MVGAQDASVAPGVRRSVLGIAAALLALVLVGGWLLLYQAEAAAVARRYVRALAPLSLPFKAQTLVMQRAALQSAGILPIYGTSELYCCGAPFNAGMFYAQAPSGFTVFNVGYPLTEDLFFAETFGALGHALAGRKVVVSDSPWFVNPGGIGALTYAHTYSQEVATVFVFDAPVPQALRRLVAERMLAFPSTLKGDVVLQTGLNLLRQGTWRGDVGYALLDPLGRVIAWTTEVRDSYATVAEIASLVHPVPRPPAPPPSSVPTSAGHAAARSVAAPHRQVTVARTATAITVTARFTLPRPRAALAALGLTLPSAAALARERTAKGLQAAVPVRPQALDWNALLRSADGLAAAAASSNPFGISNTFWGSCLDVWPAKDCQSALRLYRAGASNRAGTVFSYPTAWAQGVATCPCWTDLELEFAVLDAVGAQPLAWLQPLQGRYVDYTPYSAPARALIYDRYLAIAQAAGVPATTFQTHDSDPMFEGSFGHFTPRGWIYADRLLNLFWHGQLGEVASELAAGGSVGSLFPVSLDCPRPYDCAGVSVLQPPPSWGPVTALHW